MLFIAHSLVAVVIFAAGKQTMIESFAKRLYRSVLTRHLFFLAITLITVVGIGYHFGTFDQVFHIPYLKKSIDPSLYPGDTFLDLRFFHYSYFWFFFRPFLRLGVLEPVMFAAHVLATYFTFWMLWEFSITLFKSPLTALISTVAFMFPHIGLPGFTVIEFSLLNRTFVLPFLLAAMVLYLRRCYWPAFLILGLMYNLHVISVGFVLAMLLLDCVLRWRQIGWRNILIGLVVFAIGAAPVFVWKVHHAGIDFSLRPEVLDVAARGTLGTIYYIISDQPHILADTFCGIGTLLMFLSSWRTKPSMEHDRSMMNFVYAVGVVLVIQVITTYWLPVTIIIQMQILRVAFYLQIFAYLYFAHLIVQRYIEGHLSKIDFWVQSGAFIVIPAPLITWLLWVARNWIGRQRWRQIAVVMLYVGGTMIVAPIAWQNDTWRPGIYMYGPRTSWIDAQLWAKNNTSKDTRFITPPHIYGNYVADWRVFSERPAVATLPELQEVPFYPEYLPDWKKRFEAVAPGAVERFEHNYFTSRVYTAESFYSLTSVDMIHIAREYHASYLVVEKPYLYDFPVAYQNSEFIIYDLREYVE